MNEQTQKRLVGSVLKAMFPESYEDSWTDHLDRYPHLLEAIEYIDDWGPDLLNLNTLNENQPEFRVFIAMIRAGVNFAPEIPHSSTAFDEEAIDVRKDMEERLWQLPNANYTSREVRALPPESDLELQDLKAQAIQILIKTTLKSVLPDLRLGNLANLPKIIDRFEEGIKKEKNEDTKKRLKDQLKLLKNINKIANLELMEIPHENGGSSRHCTLAESAGGVTAKISLMSAGDVKGKLHAIIREGDDLDFKNFTSRLSSYELNTQGILKLPKHSDTKEVQREAIALNISRILGFNTTSATMVDFNGQPALHIPFDNIQLMKEFARGEKESIIIPSSFKKLNTIGDTYFHYSTIVPVGNQLHRDTMLDDFGPLMAFSWFCNDPDFIGADNQNKAVLRGKEPYVFDQVMMDSEKLSFDTRFSMVPINFGRHSRHNKGRNRSIVEDSSFDSKFQSVIHLLENKDKINIMMDNIISTHNARLKQIETSIGQIQPVDGEYSREQIKQLKALRAQHQEVDILRDDALLIKETINARMERMFTNFPSVNGERMNAARFLENRDLLKQSLLLEKLFNQPVLFSKDGRPYKNPWTKRNDNPIKGITVADGNVRLEFAKIDHDKMAYLLRKSGVDIKTCAGGKNYVQIPLSELNKINEKSLFPELHPFDMDMDYLNMDDLSYLSEGYKGVNLKQSTSEIQFYKMEMLKRDDPIDKVAVMEGVLRSVHTAQKSTKTPGFLKHVEIKLQMDMQKELRQILKTIVPDPAVQQKLARAFEAAIKLDRVNDINHVLFAFIRNPVSENKQRLINYLDRCIDHGRFATNYNNAKEESRTMQLESVEAYKAFPEVQKDSMVSMMREMRVEPERVVREEDWEDVDVIEERDLMLERERERELLDLEEVHELTDERRNEVEEEHGNTQISGTKVGAN